MIKQSDKILADELVKRGDLSQKEAEQFLSAISSSSETLNSHLVRLGRLSEKQVLEALSSVLRLANLDIKQIQIENAVIEKVPVRFAWYYKFMPIKIENKKLILASATPLDIKVQDEIRVNLGLEPQIVLAKESEIRDAQNKYYGLAADTIDRLSKETAKAPKIEEQDSHWVEDLEKGSDEATVAKLVNQILLEAYKKRATDIHVEPYRSKVRIRYRIDGVLVDANVPFAVKQFYLSIISRIKIMANLSIVEKRIPQDGSAIVKTKEQDLDLRISTIPTPYGESMVVRILPTNVIFLNLEKLGLDNQNTKIFRSLVKKPHGIILVTGPTGSGKTTTLYACLNEINTPIRKIITLEDPLEYEMEGITQIQVNNKVDLTFAAGLRSILRHDPDIIMVGEIRDLETAEIAIRTALTGHLVFSTLHTNDAASGVTRLVEMGLESFLVASSIEAFVAQRLVRLICPQCKEEVKTPLLEIREEIATSMHLKDARAVKIYKGRGCDYCNNTGFYGRSAIYEILLIDEEMRAAIIDRKRADTLKKMAIKKGMTTLRQDGWRKVANGLTTPSEVLNVTSKDELPEEPLKPIEIKGIIPEEIVNNNKTSRVLKSNRAISNEILNAKNEYDSRIYQRVPTDLKIRFSIIKQDENQPGEFSTDIVEHASIAKDVSAGGLRFSLGYTLPVGTILDLKVQLNENERSIDCLAKVCRVEEEALSAKFHIIVFYLDIPSADRAKIDKYVHHHLKQKKSS